MEPTPAAVMLSKYRLAPSRERGQNFLVDANVARKVVDAVRAGPGYTVLEVGPGFGAITFGLARRAGHVVAVEYDAGIVRAFREEYGETPGLTLIEGDALDFDLREAARVGGADRIIVAGNIPYAITSPLLRRLIDNRSLVTRAVMMVQREVAERLVATPGEAGASALTAVMGYHAVVAPLFVVRRTCFHPRPAVDSMVVEMDFQRAPKRRAEPELYSEVVHAAFGGRRKMLRRALADLAVGRGTTVEELAGRTGIDLTRRGETLSIDEFEALAVALSATST